MYKYPSATIAKIHKTLPNSFNDNILNGFCNILLCLHAFCLTSCIKTHARILCHDKSVAWLLDVILSTDMGVQCRKRIENGFAVSWFHQQCATDDEVYTQRGRPRLELPKGQQHFMLYTKIVCPMKLQIVEHTNVIQWAIEPLSWMGCRRDVADATELYRCTDLELERSVVMVWLMYLDAELAVG